MSGCRVVGRLVVGYRYIVSHIQMYTHGLFYIYCWCFIHSFRFVRRNVYCVHFHSTDCRLSCSFWFFAKTRTPHIVYFYLHWPFRFIGRYRHFSLCPFRLLIGFVLRWDCYDVTQKLMCIVSLSYASLPDRFHLQYDPRFKIGFDFQLEQYLIGKSNTFCVFINIWWPNKGYESVMISILINNNYILIPQISSIHLLVSYFTIEFKMTRNKTIRRFCAERNLTGLKLRNLIVCNFKLYIFDPTQSCGISTNFFVFNSFRRCVSAQPLYHTIANFLSV